MPTKLIVFPGSEDETELLLDGTPHVSLGRAPGCDIVVERRMASRQHAAIERSGDSFVLVDRGSYNGTYLNGRLVDRVNLADGDEIHIAGRRLRFVTEGAEEANPLESQETLPISAADREAAVRASRSLEDDTTEELEVSRRDLAAPPSLDEETTEELEVSPEDLHVGASDQPRGPAGGEALARKDDKLALEVSEEEADAALENLDLAAATVGVTPREEPQAEQEAGQVYDATAAQYTEPPGELALTAEDDELLRHARGGQREQPPDPDPTDDLEATDLAPRSSREHTTWRQALPSPADHRLLYALALVALACAVLILWSVL